MLSPVRENELQPVAQEAALAELPASLSIAGVQSAELFGIAMLAIFVRIAAISLASAIYHRPFASWSTTGDGGSYIAIARAMIGDRSLLGAFHQRVFPGYPALIVLAHLLIPSWPLAAMALSWISTAAAAVMAAVLARDGRVGWAIALLPPHFLLYTSIAMNEGVMLALCLAAILLTVRGPSHGVIIGLLFGVACIVRPMACFAGLGYLAYAIPRLRYRQIVLVGVTCLAVAGGGFLLIQHAIGNALQAVHAYDSGYGGEIITWPFKSLIFTPLYEHVPPAKIAYIWLYVIATLLAVGVMIRASIRQWSMVDVTTLLTVWLASNTLFVLCTGATWGFEAFHRFACWALPAICVAYLPILPRRWWAWVGLGAASFAIAVVSLPRN